MTTPLPDWLPAGSRPMVAVLDARPTDAAVVGGLQSLTQLVELDTPDQRTQPACGGTSEMHAITTTEGLAVPLAWYGEGRVALVLHGGGGPATVTTLAQHLGGTHRAVVPTHPGWNGTPRPDTFSAIDDLALTYLNWLQDNDLHDVLVVGSSVGGWIAAEMAVRDQDAGRISGLVLVDAVGIDVPGHPITDVFALDAREIAEHAWHDAERFYVDPGALPEEQRAGQAANLDALRVYAGDPYMYDLTLGRRLGRVRVPSLAVWGESDRIVTPAYGRAYAAALADCRFHVVADAGHLPHLEQPDATLAALDTYLTERHGIATDPL